MGAAMTDEPLLSLDTLIKRPTITIDGQPVELLNPDELSILDSHRLGILGRQIDALTNSDEPDAAEKLDARIEEAARKILPNIADDVFARISGTQRMAIVEVFTGLQLRGKVRVAGAVRKALGQPTGVTPSPDLSGSTEAAPTTG